MTWVPGSAKWCPPGVRGGADHYQLLSRERTRQMSARNLPGFGHQSCVPLPVDCQAGFQGTALRVSRQRTSNKVQAIPRSPSPGGQSRFAGARRNEKGLAERAYICYTVYRLARGKCPGVRCWRLWFFLPPSAAGQPLEFAPCDASLSGSSSLSIGWPGSQDIPGVRCCALVTISHGSAASRLPRRNPAP